jgi:ParB-like chromosome segregation protein Spo0J
MSTNENVPGGDEVFQPEIVNAKLGRVPLNQIDDDPVNFAFRDDDELTDAGIKSLAEDIAVNGLTTPLLIAKRPNGRYLLINGHRRRRAILLNIKLGVAGFTDEMLVPVFVIDIGASELALVARAVSANVQQRSLSREGRQKAVVRLKHLGMPDKEIARCVGVSEQTVERDLALVKSGCMLAHVRDRNITGSQAALLVKVAEDAGRMDDLCAAFANWVDEVKANIQAEQQRRKEADEDPLPLPDTLPRSYMTAEQVATWKTALEKGLPLTSPGFRFRAQVKEEKGERRIIIDSVKAKVSELSAKDLAKVFVRCTDLAAEIKPLLEEKARAEAAAQPAQTTTTHSSKGRDALQELGLAHLVESIADDAADEHAFDVEVDLSVSEGAQAGSGEVVAHAAAAEPPQTEVVVLGQGVTATAVEGELDELGEASAGTPVQPAPADVASPSASASAPPQDAPVTTGAGGQQ